jgi:hypothetical protein
MEQQDISTILLIRSVEECEPDYFSSKDLSEASIHSGVPEEETDWVQKRARYLFRKLPASWQEVPNIFRFSREWLALLCLGVFFLGIGLNSIGVRDNIHVMYNPVVFLLMWNMLVYCLVLVQYLILFQRKDTKGVLPSPEQLIKKDRLSPLKIQKEIATESKSLFSGRMTFGVHVIQKLFVKFFKEVFFLYYRFFEQKKKSLHGRAADIKVVRRYWNHWWNVGQAILLARLQYVIHCSAIFLVLGALVGIYMRGLFFEYTVVWKSTFIHDQGIILLLLNGIFGLPSLLLNGSFLTASHVAPLMGPQGVPAAPWIHLFAVSVFFFVVIPRAVLLIVAARSASTLSHKVTIHPGEEYYARYIQEAYDRQTRYLREKISEVLQIEISKLAESMAVYARDVLYNEQVVPKLNEFRTHGGRIRDLETEIAEQCGNFEEELNSYFERLLTDFKKTLGENVSRVMGKGFLSTVFHIDGAVHIVPKNPGEALSNSVAENMTNMISVAVTAAIAATVGTISGGFGKALGVAVLHTLLGATGPVGFIIGALLGVLGGGSAALLAKDKITDTIKGQKIPGFIVRRMLGESKFNRAIEDGRTKVYHSINEQVEKKLLLRKDEFTSRIVSSVAPGKHTESV